MDSKIKAIPITNVVVMEMRVVIATLYVLIMFPNMVTIITVAQRPWY